MSFFNSFGLKLIPLSAHIFVTLYQEKFTKLNYSIFATTLFYTLNLFHILVTLRAEKLHFKRIFFLLDP